MSDQPILRRGYVESPWGQLHYTQATPPRDAGRTPLVMLHTTDIAVLTNAGPIAKDLLEKGVHE